jgi:uncharacterized protein
MHHILFYDVVVPDYVEQRVKFRDEHLRLAREAHQRGDLVLAGAFAEPTDGAVLVFRGASTEPAEAFAKADPYVKNGLVKSWRVRKWNTVIGEGTEPAWGCVVSFFFCGVLSECARSWYAAGQERFPTHEQHSLGSSFGCILRRAQASFIKRVDYAWIERMDIERTIAEIEWLERLLSLGDTRQLQLADREAANQRHDQMYADNPWFRLWKRYGV